MPVSYNVDEVVDLDKKVERAAVHSCDIPSAADKQSAFSWSSGDAVADILIGRDLREVYDGGQKDNVILELGLSSPPGKAR